MNTAYVTTILPPVVCAAHRDESDLPLMSLAYGTALSQLTPAVYYSENKLLRPILAKPSRGH